ncbi:hypothetical protein [Maritimibacter dapengensis]|uniref:Lipoprotein n=1 Tax=Maritimibacter dapengensis TaxID=2836868 RepID=A0ABS6T3Q6_9RHOB|nr:hypothetical protein [Maritimibacter dapengensis]MBV7379879.1 hypothetical protein [Maritimibacter dapengensis]
MLSRIIGLIAVCAASPALALSCLPFGPVQAFEEADAAEDVYTVVHGSLAFDQAKAPESYEQSREQTGLGSESEPVTIPARVAGEALTREGFAGPWAADVTLEISCVGPWCGMVAPGDDVLMFLKRAGESYVLEVGACRSMAFGDARDEDLRAMEACLAGDCPSTE